MTLTVNEVASDSTGLDPKNPAEWTHLSHQQLFSMSWKDYEPIQLAAVQSRFEQLKDSVPALQRLAAAEDVTRINSLSDALRLFFDHRIYKSYPLSYIEKRDFPKLTAWLNRLTTHDLTKVDLNALTTLDSWLTRLEEFGMIPGHSTGTTGKLSFIPRSQVEFDAYKAAYWRGYEAASGMALEHAAIPTFYPGYRGGHQMAQKLRTMFHIPAAGGPEYYHSLYQTKISSDLLSLAARMQTAEDRGELDELGLDPALLEAREEMIAQGRRREEDMEAWFTKLVEEFRGKRVKLTGSFGDLTRIALAGTAKGLKCSFAPDSLIQTGGGMKGFKNPPENWEDFIKEFFGIQTVACVSGMSEVMGSTARCSNKNYHYPPYMIPIILDENTRELPRESVQTGRLALFDPLAETYWGGFISGDKVTMHWDEDCPCGWKGAYTDSNISRFADMEGGDDKITCAGTAEVYNEFMDYISKA